MTVISLTQAARQLGIDRKTLHHWLAQAHLTPQAHPSDARQKGVSLQQLHALASAFPTQQLQVLLERAPAALQV